MHKQYQEAIERSNIVSKTDIFGVITFVNDEFCKISGYNQEELIGQNHNIVRHPDVPASTYSRLWETITAKQIYKTTAKNRAKNGSTFYVNTTITPILDEQENIIEFIAIRYDVTNEVLYKHQLQKKEKELEMLNISLEQRVMEKTKELKELNETLEKRVKSRLASLGEMLANIAHQWRQPLTELNLTLFSLKKAALQKDDKEVKRLYDASKNIIQNMSNTIEDFTNFFRPGKEKHHFNVAQSIQEAIHILKNLIAHEMIIIKTDFEDLEVLGIANEFSQVIVNLIKNSKDAFVQNSILIREITISVKKEKKNGVYAVVTFEDNAGGIAEKNLYKIFEPYFTTKHASQGIGLGLFMSKMICENGLNATIDVKSKKGTTLFTIKIPLESTHA